MRAFAYIRVSGDAQADRGLPVAGQRDAITRYAAEHGIDVVRWFIDEARPGSNDDRAAFQHLMSAAHQTPAPCQAILLWSWSRFARDEGDAHYWKASLRRHGVEILDISGETPSVPGFEYVVESLIHWRDAQRLREISADARRGQQTLVRLGYVPSGCRPPRGYQVAFEKATIEGRERRLRRWVPDPAMWPIARRAWELRLQGASYHGILSQCAGLYRSVNCLSTFFANTAYKGYVTFGGARIEVDPMVTEEEWDRVRAMASPSRGGGAPRRQGSRYLLSGLVRCARCGSPLLGDSVPARRDHREWRMYICSQVKRREGCDLPRIGANALETAIIEGVMAHLLDEDSLRSEREALVAAMEEERPQMEASLVALRHDLQDTESRVRRLLDAIEGGTESASLGGRLREREMDLADIRQRIASTEKQLAGPAEAFDAASYREELQRALREGDPADARALLGQFVETVIVDDETLRLQHRVPF